MTMNTTNDGRCCRRCGSVLTAPPVLIEITFAGRPPARDARVICRECADAVVCYLQRRPEVAALEPEAVAR